MTALVVTGGECPSADFLSSLVHESDTVIAADSGLDSLLAAGVRPDILIGDFDSTSQLTFLDTFPSKAVKRFPQDKDYTDTELALHQARKDGFDYIILAGGGGGRLDHLLAIFSLFLGDSPPDEWHTARDSAIHVKDTFYAQYKPGTRLSLFPLAAGDTRMRSKGLKWPLDDLIWKPGSHGVSNIVTEHKITIEMLSGRLLLVCEHLF